MDAELQAILREVGERGEVTQELKERLRKRLGVRYDHAERAVSSGAVKKYRFLPSGRTVWIVVGKEKEYYVLPEIYCQCDDFYINVVVNKKFGACYHLLAQALAEILVKYEEFTPSDNDFIRLNSEWMKRA